MSTAPKLSIGLPVYNGQDYLAESLDALLGRAVGTPMKPPAELRQLHKEDDSTWA